MSSGYLRRLGLDARQSCQDAARFKLPQCRQEGHHQNRNQHDGGQDRQRPLAAGRVAEIVGNRRLAAIPRVVNLRMGRGRLVPFCRRGRRRAARLGLGCQHFRKLVHPLPAVGIDFHRLTQHQCEDLVTRGNLGQMNVRVEADLLEVGDAIARQRVIQILGNRIGIEARSTIGHAGGRQPQPLHYVPRAVQQIRGEFTFFDLLTDLLRILRVQDVVDVGQHRTQCQSHGSAPSNTRDSAEEPQNDFYR